MAAGSLTHSVSNVPGSGGSVRFVDVNWTSDASGAVNGNAFNLPSGSIVSVLFSPGTGSSQPTDLYDVDLVDALGVSIFDDGTGASIGANLSNVNSSRKVPFIGGATTTFVRTWVFGGIAQYELRVTNAGNVKSGSLDIFISNVPL